MKDCYLKLVNLEVIEQEPTQGSSTYVVQSRYCISKLSEEEFDKHFYEFTRNLEKITKERQAMQSKLVPNLKSDWLRNIKIDLNNLNRDLSKVGASGG